MHIPEAPFHQTPKNFPDRAIPQGYHDCSHFVSGKLWYLLLIHQSTSTEQQISSLISIRDWQARNDSARAADQRELNERLIQLEANQQRLAETLSKWS